MNNSTQADKDVVRRLDGIFVGLLTDDERESFYRCVKDHVAEELYEGAAGFMGVAKVRFQP